MQIKHILCSVINKSLGVKLQTNVQGISGIAEAHLFAAAPGVHSNELHTFNLSCNQPALAYLLSLSVI